MTTYNTLKKIKIKQPGHYQERWEVQATKADISCHLKNVNQQILHLLLLHNLCFSFYSFYYPWKHHFLRLTQWLLVVCHEGCLTWRADEFQNYVNSYISTRRKLQVRYSKIKWNICYHRIHCNEVLEALEDKGLSSKEITMILVCYWKILIEVPRIGFCT